MIGVGITYSEQANTLTRQVCIYAILPPGDANQVVGIRHQALIQVSHLFLTLLHCVTAHYIRLSKHKAVS
jgi:hypothetical protein